jgi:hypothetical protein
VLISVLGNDSDPDGDLDPSTLSIIQQPALGTATAGSGSVSYSPGANLTGADSLIYRVCDSGGRCDSATVGITITPVNDAPLAPALDLLTSRGIAATGPLSYSDIDGDTLGCSVGTAPATGSASVASNCSQVTYQPTAEFVGTVTFTVSVTDGTDITQGAVTVTVIQANRAPVATADAASTSTGTPVVIAVLGNDSDPDGDVLSIGEVSSPSAGSVSVSGDSVVYTPPAAGVGVVTFTYTACDPSGSCSAPATVTVTINAPPEE